MDHLGAAFDAARGRLVVLNGGPAGGGPRLFEWDGAAWSAASASPADVSGGHRLVYDSARGRVLLWTAEQGSETLSRLLAWDGAAWTRADG